MPTYEFRKDSDGSVVPIDAPDRTTAIRMFQSGGVAPKAQEGVVPRSNPAEFKSTDTQPAGVFSRVGTGMYDPVVGSQQLYAHARSDPEAQLGVDKYVNERERELRATGAGEGDWARTAGRMVPAAAIGTALGGPAGGITGAIAGGGVSELLNPVVTDINPQGNSNYTDVKGRQTLMGMGAGGAGGLLAKGAGKFLAPKLGADAQKMVDAGVELTPGRVVPGEIAGKTARTVEDAFHSMPGMGIVIGNAAKRSLGSYNLSQINQALSPIGAKLPADVKPGHEAINEMGKIANKAYDDILKQNPNLMMRPAIWPQLEKDINNISIAAQTLPPHSTGPQFQKIIADRVTHFLEPLAQGRPLPLSEMKHVDAELRQFIHRYTAGRAQDPSYGEMVDYLKDVRTVIRNAMAAEHPAEAAALKKADTTWSQISKIQEAANKATAEGYFTPAALLTAVRKQDPSVRHNSFAAGVTNQDMVDFAEAAHRLIPSKIADSGTTTRAAHLGGVGALTYLNPKILAGLVGGSLPYTGPGMTLTNMIANPGPKQKVVAKAFKDATPYAGSTLEPAVRNTLPRDRGDISALNYGKTSSEKGTPGVEPREGASGATPRYAEGGRPEPGEKALVGEGETPRPELWVSDSGKVRELGTHGPEVIVPDEPGTIIPNKTYKDYLMDAIRSLNRRLDPSQLLPGVPGPQTGSIPQDLAGSIPLSTLALRPGSVRLTPTNTASPRLQVNGRFASTNTGDPMWTHRGVMNSPLVGGAMATNLIPEDSAPAISRPAVPVIPEDSSPTLERPAPAAPPSMPLSEMADSGKGAVAPASPSGGGGGKSQAARAQTQKRRAQAQAPDPGLLAQIGALLRGSPDLARLVQPPRRGQAANGHYAEGGRPPAGQPAVVGDDPDRAEGIAELKRRMGGDVPWYTPKSSPARAEMDTRSGMADSAVVNAAVPRRYADGGRPPMGQPAVVGDQPDASNPAGMFANLFGGGQLPGIAKAFMGQNPLEGVDTSNQANVLSSLFGGGAMPGLASAFMGQSSQGAPSLDSMIGQQIGQHYGGMSWLGNQSPQPESPQPENPALQDDEESRRHRFGGSVPGYAEGGRPEVGEPAVVGDEMLAPEAPAMTYPTEAPAGDFSRPPLPESPFERAALTKRGGRPTPEPAPVSTPAEMAEALSVLAPAPLRAIAAAPKLATAGLAAYYGLSGTSEVGGAESPEAVKKLQTQLKESGFYGGIIDGQMGEATKKAKAAFDKAEEVRMNNEKDQARILTDQKKAEADAARAVAEGEIAKAQLEETKRKAEEEKRKGEEREAGSKRLKEVESNLSTTQKLVRDYATPIGFTGGVIGGKALQSAVAKAYNKVMGNRAAAAESVLAKEATGTPERVAAVNEFWRQGGGKVPFTNVPESTPGFAVNPKATSMDKLYKTPVATNVATDAAGAGLFGAESVAAQHWMVEPREQELKAANEAVAQDPTEVNIQRLQEAKDKLAVAEALKTMGRVGALSYLGGAAVKGRVHTKPSMDKAEAEKLDLEGVLRKSTETKARAEKLKAAKAKKASAAAEVPEGRTLNIVPAGIPPAFTGSAAAQARRVNLR